MNEAPAAAPAAPGAVDKTTSKRTADDAFTTPVDAVDVAWKGARLPIVPKLTPEQENFDRLYASSSKEHSPPQPLEVDGPKPDLDEINDLMREHGFGYVIDEKGMEQGKKLT